MPPEHHKDRFRPASDRVCRVYGYDAGCPCEFYQAFDGYAGCPAVRLEAPPAFVFHSANAYEDGGQLVADCVCYPRMPDFEQVCLYTQLHPLHPRPPCKDGEMSNVEFSELVMKQSRIPCSASWLLAWT